MTYTTDQIKQIISNIANNLGVPPNLALAIAQQESGFNPYSVGDNGTSFGLYQLHMGGELGSLTKEQAFDPATNATRALSEVASVYKQNPGADLGTIAARAQRPADPVAYASSIDEILRSRSSSTNSTYSGPTDSPSVEGTDPTNPVAFDTVFQQAIVTGAGVQDVGILGDLTGGLADKIPGVSQLDSGISGIVGKGAKTIGKASAEAFGTVFAPFLKPIDDVFQALAAILGEIIWFMHPTNDFRILIFLLGVVIAGKGFLTVVRS